MFYGLLDALRTNAEPHHRAIAVQWARAKVAKRFRRAASS